MSASLSAQIERAAGLIRSAQYPIALTGAGISVPSGIPDFRSPASGMWKKYDPAVVASIRGFRAQPERFYEWITPLIQTKLSASPNPAHHAMTTMQSLGVLNEIITQNIDGLHEESGSHSVLPLHGHTRTATCIDCGDQTDTKPIWKQVLAGKVPRCPHCGGVYKPDVVLFGEMLPDDLMWKAQQAAAQTDLILVVGSSLEVNPVALFPKLILEKGGHLLIINLGETEYDDEATVKIEADVATALPTMVEAIKAAR